MELGCKTFIRSPPGCHALTAEGEKVYERVAVAYEQLRTVEGGAGSLSGLLRAALSQSGASETALRLMLLSRLEHFHTRYPHVRLRISNHSTPQAIQALENGLVDFAVVTSPVEIRKPLHKIPIFPFQEILIGGSKYASPFRRAASSRRIVQNILLSRLPKTPARGSCTPSTF